MCLTENPSECQPLEALDAEAKSALVNSEVSLEISVCVGTEEVKDILEFFGLSLCVSGSIK